MAASGDITSRLNVKTADSTVNTYPYSAIFSNGSLTDNGDGTVSVSAGGTGGSGIVSPGTFTWVNNFGIAVSTIQVSSNTILSGATFYQNGPEIFKGSVGVATSFPISVFSNTATDNTDSSAIGKIAGASLVWGANGVGYVGSFMNTGLTPVNRNALLIKTNVTDATSYGLRVEANNAATFVVTAAGGVGISTTTPQAKLDVNGDVLVRSSATFQGNVTVSTLTISGVTFATLGAAAPNGSYLYCSDCATLTPATCTASVLTSCVCAGSGTGAFARRLNGAWLCGD